MEPEKALPSYIEFLALLYHEARNVRQLFRFNAVSKHTFGPLAEHLPPDRKEAWKRLISIQQRAAEAASAAAAADTFKTDLGCSPDDLSTLFANGAWKRTARYGGPHWAAISNKVGELGAAIDSDDEAASEKLVDGINSMRHNTGTVHDLLAGLKGESGIKAS
ncbi:MAG TPA: hypothetical protein VIX59_20090 [Candidatus Binataceae bacterium]